MIRQLSQQVKLFSLAAQQSVGLIITEGVIPTTESIFAVISSVPMALVYSSASRVIFEVQLLKHLASQSCLFASTLHFDFTPTAPVLLYDCHSACQPAP